MTNNAENFFGCEVIISGFRERDISDFVAEHPDIASAAVRGMYTADDLQAVKVFLAERGYFTNEQPSK